MSEINIIDDYDHLKRTIEFDKACDILQNVTNISEQECIFLIDFLETSEDEITLNDFIKAPLMDNSILLSIDKELLLSMLYIKNRNYDCAKNKLDNYLLKVKREKLIDEEMLNYYSQLSLVLKFYNLVNEDEIEEYVNKFSKNNCVKELYDMLTNDLVFVEFPVFYSNANCRQCKFVNQCLFSNEFRIFNSIIQKKINKL